MSQLTTADKIAMYGGGGLVTIGVVLIGLIEMLAGTAHPVDSDGQIVHESLIDPQIRSYIILAGFVIWGLYAIYRVALTTPQTGGPA